MRLAIAQLTGSSDKAANADSIARMVALAAKDAADWVVFPEAAMSLSLDPAEIIGAAEPLDGPFVKSVSNSAMQHGVGIVLGLWEKADGTVYNTVVVIDSRGELLTHYRKVHLYDAFGFRESDIMSSSPNPVAVTFPVDDLTVGIATCYDLRFPESARVLADQQADVMVFPAAWVPGPMKEDHWKTLVKARAIENTVYVVAVNQTPPFGTGRSLIVDANGLIVGELGIDEVVRTFDIDIAQVRAAREKNPSLANRRYSVVAHTANTVS